MDDATVDGFIEDSPEEGETVDGLVDKTDVESNNVDGIDVDLIVEEETKVGGFVMDASEEGKVLIVL